MVVFLYHMYKIYIKTLFAEIQKTTYEWSKNTMWTYLGSILKSNLNSLWTKLRYHNMNPIRICKFSSKNSSISHLKQYIMIGALLNNIYLMNRTFMTLNNSNSSWNLSLICPKPPWRHFLNAIPVFCRVKYKKKKIGLILNHRDCNCVLSVPQKLSIWLMWAKKNSHYKTLKHG